jgi:hypothetical protein
MAESYGDNEKDKFVVAFGESDGGHSFVTLSDAIDAEHIKSVQPQDDTWGAIDALRNGSAQIAVIPFSNKITSAESATVAGLASGDLKILGQIQRRTNHVLVGLKHNINRVDQAAREAGYADAMMSHTGDGAKHVSNGVEPTSEAVKQFVFLLHVVHSSKTVFDQTRGKLTGSDFRSAIRVEHTSNPMRVLLRDHRERKTMAIVDAMERKNAPQRPLMPVGSPQAMGQGGTASPFALNVSEPRHEKPIEEDFFSAALVAEGLLESANRVCRVGPGLKPNKLCSQRLSEITEHLSELQTDAEAPLDLPNNVTTFLVVQAANAKLSDGLKKKFPWESGATRLATQRAGIENDIRSCQSKIKKFEAAIASTKAQIDEASDPLKAQEHKDHLERLESELANQSKELSLLQKSLNSLEGRVLGPSSAKPSLRAAFLLAVDGADADWSKAFKLFETKMGERFKGLKLRFDQSPELANHLGKQVLLVSARIDGAGSATAAQIEGDMSRFFKRQKDQESKAATSLAWLADQAAGGQPKKFEPKLLGVYPSWTVSGAHRDLWTAEGGAAANKADEKVIKRTMNFMGIALFVMFWMAVIFMVTVTSTPYGRTWAMGLWDGFLHYLRTLFLGPS